MINLIAALDSALLPYAFARTRGGTKYQRVIGGSHQTVGIRKSRTGDDTAAVYFEERAPDKESASFELSPIAPLRNTYWWPMQLPDVEASRLIEQLNHIVLPFFNSTLSATDAEAAADEMLSSLTQLKDPFQRSDNTYWRIREGVIDLLITEFMAHSRFLRLSVAVWHEDLVEGISGALPEGITLAAWHSLGKDTIDGESMQQLIHLGKPIEEAQESIRDTLLPAALTYFNSINTPTDVLAQVRREYKHQFMK